VAFDLLVDRLLHLDPHRVLVGLGLEVVGRPLFDDLHRQVQLGRLDLALAEGNL
jgi:hypothetical protein